MVVHLMLPISAFLSRSIVQVPRRMTLASIECTILQRIHRDFRTPMKYPPCCRAEQKLAAATRRDQGDR
jgi:hypothetical protein